MRLLTATLSTLLFISLPLSAETSTPYEQMTLEELKQVNCGDLERADKKRCKKALKAAKRAEKERLKAEKKRQKTEARRLAKKRKAAKNSVRYIEKVYRETDIYKDDFEAHVSIRGYHAVNKNTSFSSMALAPDVVTFSLTGAFFPENEDLFLQAFVFMETSKFLSDEEVLKMEKRPMRYAWREGVWRHYNRATLRGGKEMDIAPIDQRAELAYGTGKFYEDLRISIDLEDVEQAVSERRPLDFKLASPNAPSLVVTIPYEYLLGFGMRLTELGSDIGIDRAQFEAPYRALMEASGQ